MNEISNKFAANFTKHDLDKIFINAYNKVTIEKDKIKYYMEIFDRASNIYFRSNKDFSKFLTKLRKELKIKDTLSKSRLNAYYSNAIKKCGIQRNYNLERYMKLKASRSRSGVISVTIFTSGELLGSDGKPIKYDNHDNPNHDSPIEDNIDIIKRGGCPMNCHYCPFEKDENGVPTQPRSYLSTEPGNMRATQNKHHPIAQVYDRLRALDAMGHLNIFDTSDSSKIELIISGGTFNFYPEKYILWFAKCAYYAFNTYLKTKLSYIENGNCQYRDILSLSEEQNINESSNFRVVGLTIETRPDYITPKNKSKKIDFSQINLFRKIGVTRVQIGVQTTDDTILNKINRKCQNIDNKLGLRRLKQNGFKTDIHIMLDLPGSSPQIDKNVLADIVYGEDLRADQWKIYPTEVTPFTKIKEWYDNGSYKPYAELDNSEKIIEVVIYALLIVPKYVRINRVVRDIPDKSILGGLKYSNLRQVIKDRMDKDGLMCSDIREREIKFNEFNTKNIKLDIIKYNSSSGLEYFISYCSKDDKLLYGFIRLRLNREFNDVLDCLKNKALIRELHVFGEHCSLGEDHNKGNVTQHKGNVIQHKGNVTQHTQHKGLGKKLIKIAEIISYINNYNEIAIISGTGVRNYYRKQGYILGEYDYMYKKINISVFIRNSLNLYLYCVKYFLAIILIYYFIVKVVIYTK